MTKTKTNTTGSKPRHLADLTFKQVNTTVDLHSSDVPSTEQRKYKIVLETLLHPSRSLWWSSWQDRVSQHNTRLARPRSRLQRTRPRPIFWSQTGLVLRLTVSDHITVNNIQNGVILVPVYRGCPGKWLSKECLIFTLWVQMMLLVRKSLSVNNNVMASNNDKCGYLRSKF